MVIIQRKKEQFTITLPKDVVTLMGWDRGDELYPYPDEKGNLILKHIKPGTMDRGAERTEAKITEKGGVTNNAGPGEGKSNASHKTHKSKGQFTFGFPVMALFALSLFGMAFQGLFSFLGGAPILLAVGDLEGNMSASPIPAPSPSISPSPEISPSLLPSTSLPSPIHSILPEISVLPSVLIAGPSFPATGSEADISSPTPGALVSAVPSIEPSPAFSLPDASPSGAPSPAPTPSASPSPSDYPSPLPTPSISPNPSDIPFP